MNMALQNTSQIDISYGIYTIERLPKGSRRTPKWDLHSISQDRATAENHAETLAAQPYFDHIEVKEFKILPDTNERLVTKIRSYSRNSSKIWIFVGVIIIALLLLLKFLT